MEGEREEIDPPPPPPPPPAPCGLAEPSLLSRFRLAAAAAPAAADTLAAGCSDDGTIDVACSPPFSPSSSMCIARPMANIVAACVGVAVAGSAEAAWLAAVAAWDPSDAAAVAAFHDDHACSGGGECMAMCGKRRVSHAESRPLRPAGAAALRSGRGGTLVRVERDDGERTQAQGGGGRNNRRRAMRARSGGMVPWPVAQSRSVSGRSQDEETVQVSSTTARGGRRGNTKANTGGGRPQCSDE